MQENITVPSMQRLVGTIDIPGDKSISHRSIMLSSLADTPVVIKNFLYAQDCLSTISCMSTLGVKIEQDNDHQLHIQGNGLYGLTEPETVLDAGNSGTTLRLLTGILAGQPFFTILTGDASLSRRPMGRVITPLTKMGCRLTGRQQSRYLPLAIMPGDQIAGIEYNMPMASAQVKSAIMLATLFANSPSTITEPQLSRDHTERMLEMFGVQVTRKEHQVTVYPVQSLTAPTVIEIPGDISSAAFWLVAATIIPGSNVTLKNVGINPTRTGILDVLWKMGANIVITNERLSGKEPIADITVTSSTLQGVTIESEIIPRLIDEIPILAVAALFAKGRTIISGAEELRVKETDRLKAIAVELGKMGAQIQEMADGLTIEGPQSLHFASCHSQDDHRMAMAVAVAGAAAAGVDISQHECVNISYPDFFTELNRLIL